MDGQSAAQTPSLTVERRFGFYKAIIVNSLCGIALACSTGEVTRQLGTCPHGTRLAAPVTATPSSAAVPAGTIHPTAHFNGLQAYSRSGRSCADTLEGLRWDAMLLPPGQTECSTCPFIDRNDHRCAARFTLSRLNEAFEICLGEYRSCGIYQQLRHGTSRPTVVITYKGRPAAVVASRRLRPTGT